MKVVFTIGTFDNFNKGNAQLIKRMKRAALPEGEIFVLLKDNLSIYKETGAFPVQDFKVRKNNLEYFVKSDGILFFSNELDFPQKMISSAIDKYPEGTKFIYLTFSEDKNFPERKILEEFKIPVKFIKNKK